MDLIINSRCSSIEEAQQQLPSQGSWQLNLLACLGYDVENPPLATLLSQHHDLHGDWVVVSPVFWEASHNNAMITASGEQLSASEEDLTACFHQYADFLHAAGMALYYHDQYTWLLSAPNKARLQAKPVLQMIHRPLINELSLLDETLFWQKLLTESQMFFASKQHHSINGVWFWGTGILANKKNRSICTTEDYLSVCQCCSTSVSLYGPEIMLQDFDTVLIKDRSVLTAEHQQKLKKIPVNYYWNDSGYSLAPRSLISRLWRKFAHDH